MTKRFNLTDEDRVQTTEVAGRWLVGSRTGVKFKLGHPADPEFEKAQQRFEREERRDLGWLGKKIDKPLPDKNKAAVFSKSICYVLLKDWDGIDEVVDGAQVPVSYTPEKGIAVLEKYWRVRADILDLLGLVSGDEAEELEAIGGN